MDKNIEHSVKVPRLYKVATNILKAYKADRGSIKSLVYESQKKHPNIKALYALVTQCVQNSDQIKASFEKIGLFEKEPRFDRNLAEILTTELVFGRKLLPGKSRPEETLRKYESELLKCISGPVQEKPGSTLPRYVRVNALKATLELVTQQLVSEGFVEVVYDRKRTSYDEFLDLIDNLANRQFLLDYHIDNLLVFPPKTHFYDNPLYKDGMILLQDKASCLTVQALEVPCGSVVLDACAAPGMKTSQIAATVFRNRSTGERNIRCDSGEVIAIERDPKRCDVLRKMMRSCGGFEKKVRILNHDFSALNTEDFAHVEYIVLDPSCSGSGMVQREGDADVTKDRLEKLSALQNRLLQHAMSFPNVKKIAYSTCSTSEIENENVVDLALNSNYGLNFEVTNCLSDWTRRGTGNYVFADKCVRAESSQDKCNGFFVTVFQKKETFKKREAEKSENENPSKKKKKKKHNKVWNNYS